MEKNNGKSNKKSELWNKIVAFVTEMITIYTDNHVPRAAAALSYILTMSIFPFLIVLHAVLVMFMPGLSPTLDYIELEGLIPSSALDVITDYMRYVSMHNNDAMMTAGVLGMLTTSAAAFRTIHGIMGEIQGETRFTGFGGLVFSFGFSFMFLLAIYFGILVIVTGNWLTNLITGWLSGFFPIFETIALWQALKYPVLFLLFSFIIWGLYRLTTHKKVKKLLPGTIVAAVAMVVVSVVFSHFISLSTRYPLIYGSLASIIIFMLWLYTSGIVLIMGNVINLILKHLHDEKGTKKEKEQENESPS